MTKALDNLLARAVSQAKLLGLRSVVPHALFVVTHQALGEEANRLLTSMGVDARAYCLKVFEELKSMPRVKRHEGEIPVHEATRRILEKAGKRAQEMDAARPESAPYQLVLEELLRADGIGRGSEGDGDPFAELDALIGLDAVKTEVHKLVELVKFTQARQKNGLSCGPLTSHFVFTGNPGTGKTTVARIVAGIYRELGVLKRGHLVEVDRSKLVAGYVGQSAIQANAVIDAAMDGVLFIDEAYSLVSGGANDYGGEVIATLLKRMEDARDRLVVIVAGYTQEMERFVASNPGLKSRFTKFIDFPDYTAAELTRIFEAMMQASDYVCSPSVLDAISKRIAAVVAPGGAASGNARAVRNLFAATKERMALRVMNIRHPSKRQLQEIELEDVGL